MTDPGDSVILTPESAVKEAPAGITSSSKTMSVALTSEVSAELPDADVYGSLGSPDHKSTTSEEDLHSVKQSQKQLSKSPSMPSNEIANKEVKMNETDIDLGGATMHLRTVNQVPEQGPKSSDMLANETATMMVKTVETVGLGDAIMHLCIAYHENQHILGIFERTKVNYVWSGKLDDLVEKYTKAGMPEKQQKAAIETLRKDIQGKNDTISGLKYVVAMKDEEVVQLEEEIEALRQEAAAKRKAVMKFFGDMEGDGMVNKCVDGIDACEPDNELPSQEPPWSRSHAHDDQALSRAPYTRYASSFVESHNEGSRTSMPSGVSRDVFDEDLYEPIA
ncbi:Hypothetical protein D9617_4g001050 [Elsinoe fawcettii]|nr:Hypothetical protein D9617_4g001050 [Elsinoe fawcettii]